MPDSYRDMLFDGLLKLYQMIPGPGMLPVRQAQIQQYLHPEQDVLPRQLDRPQDLTKFQNQDFRSMRDFIEGDLVMPKDVVGHPTPQSPLASLATAPMPLIMASEMRIGASGRMLKGRICPCSTVGTLPSVILQGRSFQGLRNGCGTVVNHSTSMIGSDLKEILSQKRLPCHQHMSGPTKLVVKFPS